MNPWEIPYDEPVKQQMPWEVEYQKPVAKEAPGFFDRQRQLGADLANAVNLTSTAPTGNQQTPGETITQGVLSNAVGGVADAVGTGLAPIVGAAGKFAYNNLMTDDGRKRIDSDIKKFAPLIEQYNKNQELYAEDNPRAARNFAAIRELGNVMPTVAIPGATKQAINKTGTAFKNAAMHPVEGVSSVVKGVNPSSVDARNALRSNYEQAANKAYGAVRESGAILKPEKQQNLLKEINDTLAKRGRLNTALHPKTLAILQDIKQDLDEGILDIERIDQNRRLLSRIKPGLEGKEDFGAAQAAVRVIDKFDTTLKKDDFLNGSPEIMTQLKMGRSMSQKAMKIEKISDIIQDAGGDPNRIKAALTRFVNNKKNRDKNGRLIGFTEEEDFAIKKAAQSSTTEKLLKMAGKFGIDLGTSLTPGNTVAPLVGGAITGSGGGAAVVIGGGTVARQLQKYMARGKIDNVIDVIKKGGIPKEIAAMPTKEAKKVIEDIRSGKD